MTSHNRVFEHEGQAFSYREAEIMLACLTGLTIAETADLLGISYATVKSHREHLCHRFGLHGHNALLIFAMKLWQNPQNSADLPIKLGTSAD
jgi:DNA-binding CsgD family transcriptional regulator